MCCWIVQENLTEKLELEQFVCYMYGFLSTKSVNVVRSLMLRNKLVGESKQITKSSKVDLARLPPCH